MRIQLSRGKDHAGGAGRFAASKWVRANVGVRGQGTGSRLETRYRPGHAIFPHWRLRQIYTHTLTHTHTGPQFPYLRSGNDDWTSVRVGMRMNRSGVGKTHALALRQRLVVSSWETCGTPSLLRGPQFALPEMGIFRGLARTRSHRGAGARRIEERLPHPTLSLLPGLGEGVRKCPASPGTKGSLGCTRLSTCSEWGKSTPLLIYQRKAPPLMLPLPPSETSVEISKAKMLGLQGVCVGGWCGKPQLCTHSDATDLKALALGLD